MQNHSRCAHDDGSGGERFYTLNKYLLLVLIGVVRLHRQCTASFSSWKRLSNIFRQKYLAPILADFDAGLFLQASLHHFFGHCKVNQKTSAYHEVASKLACLSRMLRKLKTVRKRGKLRIRGVVKWHNMLSIVECGRSGTPTLFLKNVNEHLLLTTINEANCRAQQIA